LTHDEAMLKYIVKLVGANRIALGSDYPFPLGENNSGKFD
jgi:aminocarboxymuconate-semialdehyde decarboxylase